LSLVVDDVDDVDDVKIGVDKDTEEFWVLTTVFDKEFVVGVNKAELVKELQRLGLLLPPRLDGTSVHQLRAIGDMDRAGTNS
jgi:hypothetical protein